METTTTQALRDFKNYLNETINDCIVWLASITDNVG